MNRSSSFLLGAFVSLLATQSARASGLDAPLVGTGQSSPTACDSVAIYWNPAQLACLEKAEILLGGGLIVGNIGYERERLGSYQPSDGLEFRLPVASIDEAKTARFAKVTATPIAPLGNLFAALPLIPKRLVLGAGVYIPYAAALSFPKDGPQAWQVRDAFIAATNVTLSAAVRATDWLSFGAGISYVGGFAALSKLQDFASLKEFSDGLGSLGQANDFGPNAPPQVRELRTLSRPFSLTNAFSNGITFNAGVSVKPVPALTLGLSYQHGTAMSYRGDFAIDMNDPFFTRDLAAQGLQYKPLVAGKGELAFDLPKRLTLGAAYDVDSRWRVDGFFALVFYSDLKVFRVKTSSAELAQPGLGIGDSVTVSLPRDWQNTVWAEANVRYRLLPTLLVSLTAGYQSAASPDSSIDTTSPDGHRLIGAAGLALDIGAHATLFADARLQGILPRRVTTSVNDLGNGTYHLFIAAGALHFRWRF